ncbi:MAG: hypothetical protein ACJ8F7_06085 [Gemmataceae bacterium]
MKTYLQIGVLIVVLMAVVYGATYLTNYTTQTKKPDDGGAVPPPPTASDPIVFPGGKIAIWDKDVENITEDQDAAKYARQVEPLSENQYDFKFYNPHADAASVKLTFTSCTCTHVDLGVFPEADWAQWQRQHMLSAAASLTGAPPLLTALAAVKLHAHMRWTAMPDPKTASESDPGVPVPAAVGGIPHPGVVRVHFRPKALSDDPQQPDRLRIRLKTEAAGLVAIPELNVSYFAVPPLGSFPNKLEIPELGGNQKRAVEVLIWSTTRPKLEPMIEVKGPDPDDKDNPCFEIGPLVPLTPAELRILPKAIGREKSRLEALCGYRITVTVHESRNGRQLDMGPFSRRLELRADAASDPKGILITGLVLGEVKVLDGDERDRIPLGDFKVDRGASRVVTLATSNLDVDLAPEVTANEPSITAKLNPPEVIDGQKRWKLLVEIKPTSPGDLPQYTAIELQVRVKGANTRKLRIPVAGHAHR